MSLPKPPEDLCADCREPLSPGQGRYVHDNGVLCVRCHDLRAKKRPS